MSRFSHATFAALLLGDMATAAFAQPRPPAPLKPDAKSAEISAANLSVFDHFTLVTDAMLRAPADGEWINWRRTYDAQGFSPLTQINKKTVSALRPVWTWSMPAGSSQMTPLVHDGIMFVYGVGDHVQALDALNGNLLWEYTHPLKKAGALSGLVKRAIAIYGDKIFFATTDSHLVALEAKTGKLVWDVEIAGPAFNISSGPMVVNGKVIQGVAGCTGIEPGGCYIVALDAATGKQVWRFNTLTKPGEKGGDTWNDLPIERRMGGSIWSTASYDAKLNLLLVGTGNTYNWQQLTKGQLGKDTSKDAGLYTDSTLALDPDTGKLKWYYQHLPGEPWDLDFAFENIVADIDWKGKPTRVVMTTGKTAITDGMDAATGKWLFSKDQGLQNVVKSIDPKTGKKTYNPEALPDPTFQRHNFQCPAGFSDKNYPANSYNPATRMMYITLAEDCGEAVPLDLKPEDYTGQGQETRATRYQPGSDGNIGRVDAVNIETQKTVWSKRQRAPVTSAALATAGGLVFAGDMDRWFKAYDDATGDVLWQLRLNDGITSYPISYSINGKQYVAVLAGIGGPRMTNLQQMVPDLKSPRGGGAVMWVFEVP